MLIILDRDGVINRDDDGYINNPDDWHPFPGSIEAIADLSQAGHRVVVMTNQSGIARGYITEEALADIHDKMLALVNAQGGDISGIYYCPHHPDEECACRKPQPGMLHQMAKDFPDIDFKQAVVIGDSWRDILAGKNVGAKTMLVKTGYGKIAYAKHQSELKGTHVVDDLRAAVNWILEKHPNE